MCSAHVESTSLIEPRVKKINNNKPNIQHCYIKEVTRSIPPSEKNNYLFFNLQFVPILFFAQNIDAMPFYFFLPKNG